MDFAAWEKGKKKMDELKKCPFCGGKAAVVVNDGAKVMCITCGAQTASYIDFATGIKHGYSSVQRVVDAWNRRSEHG